jgi:hypothetical protein
MRPGLLFALLLTILQGLAFSRGPISAQARPQPSGQAPVQTQAQQKVQQKAAPSQANQADQLGMTCMQILQMSSADWVAHFSGTVADKPAAPPAKGTAANGPAHTPTEKTLRAITAYGKCYDARTDRLSAALAKSGKGPLMGARGNFRDFEQTVQNFTAKALADSQPPADAQKSAYAAMYEKQFRYEFYQVYDQQAAKPSPAPEAKTAAKAETKTSAATPPPPLKSTPVASTTPSSRAAAPATGAANATTTAPAATAVDPVTLAKNYFGGLLADLPDDKMHDLHAAFGDILVRNSVGAGMQLSLYRYAIFLIEPPPGSGNSGQPFAPPPF